MAIWQDLVDDHGFAARYASVWRFVVRLRGVVPAEARVVITTAPGEDYRRYGKCLRDRRRSFDASIRESDRSPHNFL